MDLLGQHTDRKNEESPSVRVPLHRTPSKPLQNVDDLYNKLGDPGRLQVLLFLLLAFNLVIVASNHIVGVFFGFTPAHYCNAPADWIEMRLANETTSYGGLSVGHATQISQNMSSLATLSPDEVVLDKEPLIREACQVIYALDGMKNVTKSCSKGQWVYDMAEDEQTTVTDFDLVCDHAYLSNLASTLYYVGVMLGGFVWGYISDVFGRKPVVTATLLLSLTTGLAISFATNFAVFVVLRVLMGAFNQGLQTSSIILAIELFPVHHRSLAGVSAQIFWGIGVLYLSGAAWLSHSWHYIQLALLAPNVLSAVSVWFQPESLRWLLARSKTHKASLVIRKFTTFNHLPNPVGNEHSLLAEYKVHYVKHHASYFTLMKTPNLRKRTIIMSFIWFSANIGYFGMTYGGSQLAGNRYLNFFLGGLMELIVLIIGAFVIVRFGRKKPVITLFLVGAIFCFLAGVIPRSPAEDQGTAKGIIIIVFAIVGRSAMSGLFVVMDIYASELFPTVVRNMGIGVCTFLARLGAMLAPQVYVLSSLTFSQLPPLLFAALAVTGAILTCLLPETSGQHLPDTVQDVETNFGWTDEHVEETSMEGPIENT